MCVCEGVFVLLHWGNCNFKFENKGLTMVELLVRPNQHKTRHSLTGRPAFHSHIHLISNIKIVKNLIDAFPHKMAA